jgi:hypothetical protein
MRQVVIEYARKVLSEKRGGRAEHVDITDVVLL